MKLNLNFVNKVPKIAKDNEIILLTQKVKKSKEIKELTKSVFSNKLFLEQNFLTKDYNNKSYILVNCTKSKVSLDFEKLGSKLFVFLKEIHKKIVITLPAKMPWEWWHRLRNDFDLIVGCYFLKALNESIV